MVLCETPEKNHLLLINTVPVLFIFYQTGANVRKHFIEFIILFILSLKPAICKIKQNIR